MFPSRYSSSGVRWSWKVGRPTSKPWSPLVQITTRSAETSMVPTSPSVGTLPLTSMIMFTPESIQATC